MSLYIQMCCVVCVMFSHAVSSKQASPRFSFASCFRRFLFQQSFMDYCLAFTMNFGTVGPQFFFGIQLPLRPLDGDSLLRCLSYQLEVKSGLKKKSSPTRTGPAGIKPNPTN